MIKTTLYDLIDAISTDLTNEEDELVIATVVYLIQSGRIRFLKNLQQHN
jgi:predicted HTH domain antitoxin